MKKIVASVGLVAVGVSGAFAPYAHGLSAMDTSKAWSITASLRGFYDDNYLTAATNERDSLGIEVSPGVGYNLHLDQTIVSLSYLYRGRYYEDRSSLVNVLGNTSIDSWDHSHQFEFALDHAFSERYSLSVRDSFVIAQEPELLSADANLVQGFHVTPGDNLRNLAQVGLNAQLTRLLGLKLSYRNVLVDYDQDNVSAVLDRLEHLGSVELNWQALPETAPLIGYSIGALHYTDDQPIGVIAGQNLMPDIRDYMTHAFYGGVRHNLGRNASVEARVGANYIGYDNKLAGDSSWSPYAQAFATYSYASGCQAQLGFIHTYSASDVVSANAATGISSSLESSSVYALLTHQITPRLVGDLTARYQHSVYEGGPWEKSADDWFGVGVNFTYAFSETLPAWLPDTAEAGYNLTKLDSDLPGRGYDRNQAYLGVAWRF